MQGTICTCIWVNSQTLVLIVVIGSMFVVPQYHRPCMCVDLYNYEDCVDLFRSIQCTCASF